ESVDDPARGLNRHVRPLLRALGGLGISASFGGRDVVRARGRSIAHLGARHSRSSQNFGLEAIVAVTRDFAVPARFDLAAGDIAPRFGGAAPSSLAIVGDPGASSQRVRDAIVDAFSLVADRRTIDLEANTPEPRSFTGSAAPPFDAMIEVPIGLVGAACEGVHVRLGGDFMLSDDALDALHAALDVAPDDAIEATIDAHLGPASGAMLIGVRELSVFARLVRLARTKMRTAQAG
ncbi:MAG: hypothetical protein ACHREM_29540, partial [Polyangiales bacterium]